MLIDRLQPESVALASASLPASPSSHSSYVPTPQTEKQKPLDPVIADQVLVSKQTDSRIGDIVRQNERNNSAAAAIHRTDEAARELGQRIDKLKEPLDAIVKNFPPFAPQDKERVKLLRTYNAIRKEIDQLTLPPPPSVVEARKLTELPEPLSMNADDSQIADHVDKLDAAARSLQDMRGDIAAGTASLLRDGRFVDMFPASKGSESLDLSPIASDAGAVQKSVEVGQQFADSVAQGVTLQRPQFLKGLS